MRRSTIGGFVLLSLVILSSRAEAIPALARKTGMGCPACHDAWPKLNDFGEMFRDRGYLVGEATDDNISNRTLDYVPLSFRTTVGYEFMSTSNQMTDKGPTTVNSGGFFFPGVDLLLAESFGRHFSVLGVVSGFSSDGVASVESAWARFNDLGTTWFNIRVGKHELDLPSSEHRAFSLTSGHLIYGWHPIGSTNSFSMGDNQIGIELMGHSRGPGFRYALSFTTDSSSTGSGAFSEPNLYLHLTYTILPANRIFSRVRVGAVANIGWMPTHFLTLTPTNPDGTMGTPANVVGTGDELKTFEIVGGHVGFSLGPLARPFSIQAFWAYGQENAAITANGTQAASWHGGFVEADYTPFLSFTVFARYDGVFPLQQADPTQPNNSNQQDQFTAGARYYAFVRPWGSIASHVEFSTNNIQNSPSPPAVAGAAVRGTSAMAAVDFAM